MDYVTLREMFDVPAGAKMYAVIWTTTPWTLPANQAVCVHPDVEYAMVRTERAYLLIAKDLVPSTLERMGLSGEMMPSIYKGKELESNIPLHTPFSLEHPIWSGHYVRITLGTHVTTDAGTGLVHTAPAHGVDDYQVGLAYSLDTHSPVDAHGKFFAPEYLQPRSSFAVDHNWLTGKTVWEGNAIIIDALKRSGNLLSHHKIQHSYPHCWRHKTPLIFRATAQWFIGMDKPDANGLTLRDISQEAINSVRFYPDWGKARLSAMIEKSP